MALVVPSSACNFFRPGGGNSASSATSPGTLISEWSMTRVSNEPPFPKEMDILTDQVFPKSPTWKITISGNQPAVTYNDKKIWFNSMGFSVTINTPTIAFNPDKKSGVVSGGGHVGASGLPGALAIIGLAKSISNISIDYTDKVDITLSSPDEITATITYVARGGYSSSDGKQPINQQGKLVYTGKRK